MRPNDAGVLKLLIEKIALSRPGLGRLCRAGTGETVKGNHGHRHASWVVQRTAYYRCAGDPRCTRQNPLKNPAVVEPEKPASGLFTDRQPCAEVAAGNRRLRRAAAVR